jgi:hypothetical protein
MENGKWIMENDKEEFLGGRWQFLERRLITDN